MRGRTVEVVDAAMHEDAGLTQLGLAQEMAGDACRDASAAGIRMIFSHGRFSRGDRLRRRRHDHH